MKKKLIFLSSASVLLVTAMLSTVSFGSGKTKNGFDLSNATIPAEEIFSGGPGKDGIPSIDAPKFVSAKQANLKPSDRILGLEINGEARAYPVKILNWHEIVNDSFQGNKVLVTFCPLCGSGLAFSSTVAGKELTFGVSGLLYNSDVLLFDRQTNSLWSQIKSTAISGAYKNSKLTPLQLQNTSWQHWQSQFPNTKVLSEHTGFARSYERDPYQGYEQIKDTFFPVKFRALGIHPKEKVVAITINKQSKAWPFIELQKSGGTVNDTVAGKKLVIRYDNENKSARIFDQKNIEQNSATLFWFAWAAFNPETKVYKASK